MKKRLELLRDRYRSDYRFKTFASSLLSVLIGIGFAVFNAVLGILYNSVWNGSVSVYYMLLAMARGIIVFPRRDAGTADSDKIKRVCVSTHILLLFIDLCLIAPIAYMVMGERSYRFGMIPAIAMAAYTTYRVTMSAVQYRSSRMHENILVKELRVINLQDALVAVLSLQNALIIACGTSAKSMIRLTGWTGAGIWSMIVFFTVRSFVGIRTERGITSVTNLAEPFSNTYDK